MFVYFFLSVFFSIFRLSLFDLIYLFSRSTHWIPLDEQSRVRKSEDFHLSGEDSPLKQRDCLGLTPKLPESHFVSRYSWGCSRVISYVQLVALAGKETLCMCVCVCVCVCVHVCVDAFERVQSALLICACIQGSCGKQGLHPQAPRGRESPLLGPRTEQNPTMRIFHVRVLLAFRQPAFQQITKQLIFSCTRSYFFGFNLDSEM